MLAIAQDEPELREPVSTDGRTILAQIAYAVRHEMAMTLADVLFHRTGLGFRGYPGEACLQLCAEQMARELGWDAGRITSEVEAVRKTYQRRGLLLSQNTQTP
ncbi:MAG: glycerol-3-phosphate dehydrogenase C-terminal domain-containing protein [Phycisphaerales bacterium]